MVEIKITNVTKQIRGNEVLHEVSMNLHGGTVIGLAGVNGAGKTMLMRVIAGLIFPTTGYVEINGKRLGKDMEFPDGLGILIENPAFLDNYSGFQNLQILASIREKAGDEEIRNILRSVGLNPDDRKKYRKYSLGMKQRLGIAAAIFEKPEILILDEPTNALDQDGVSLLKQIVRKQREAGTLVIMSCHDRPILEELSDEIYQMENGRVVD